MFRGWICFLHLRRWWQQRYRCVRSRKRFAWTELEPHKFHHREIRRHGKERRKDADVGRIFANFQWRKERQRSRRLRGFPWVFEIVRQRRKRQNSRRRTSKYVSHFRWVHFHYPNLKRRKKSKNKKKSFLVI